MRGDWVTWGGWRQEEKCQIPIITSLAQEESEQAKDKVHLSENLSPSVYSFHQILNFEMSTP